jgi:hypothetical protein
MPNISVQFQNLTVADENITKFNDSLEVTLDEFGSVNWGDFQGAKLIKSGDNILMDLPTLSGEFLKRDDFVSEFAKYIDSGIARIQFVGNVTQNYIVSAGDTSNTIKKFENRPIQIGDTLSINKVLVSVTPSTYNTTLNSGDTAVNNVSLDGVGSLEFNNLNSSDDPVTDLKTANILVDGIPVAQVTFTTSYLTQTARYIKDGVNYTIVLAETSITATVEA